MNSKMYHHCGTEMQDMGQWPNSDLTKMLYRWHCLKCNKYEGVQIEGVELTSETETMFKMAFSK